MKGSIFVAVVALAQPVALLFATPVAAQGSAGDQAKYIAAPMGDYTGKISVNDDPASPRIVISSVNAWRSSGGDMYLGASINRATREVRYFVYQTPAKAGGDWASYDHAQLTTSAGPVDITPAIKNDTVMGFSVARAVLDQYAAKTPGSGDRLGWQLKGGAKDLNGLISVGEIQAFLAVVDSQKAPPPAP